MLFLLTFLIGVLYGVVAAAFLAAVGRSMVAASLRAQSEQTAYIRRTNVVAPARIDFRA